MLWILRYLMQRWLAPMALSWLNTAIEEDPSKSELYSQRATILRVQGRLAAAARDAAKSFELAPSSEALQRAIKLYGRAHQWEEAAGLLSQARQLGQDEQLIDVLSSTIAPRVIDAKAWADRARFELDYAEYSDAVRSAQRALSLDPDLTAAKGLLGEAYYCTSRFNEAKDYLMQATSGAPSRGRWYFFLGLSQFCEGEYQDSLKSFEQCLEEGEVELLPLSPMTWRGWSAFALGQDQLAEQCFLKAINGDFADEAKAGLAWVYSVSECTRFHSKHYASVALKYAKQTFPDPRAKTFKIEVLAAAFAANGKYAKALKLLGRIKEQSDPSPLRAAVQQKRAFRCSGALPSPMESGRSSYRS